MPRLATALILESDLSVIFTYSPQTSEAIDALEVSLSYQLRQSASPWSSTPVALCCGHNPVALQRKGDLLYAVAASSADDELGGSLAACPSPLCLSCPPSPLFTLLPLPEYSYTFRAALTLKTYAFPPTQKLTTLARAVIELLDSVYRVVSAACEKEPPTAARLTSFYGKVVVCLHEAFSGQGFQLQRNVESILRNAKLKAPA